MGGDRSSDPAPQYPMYTVDTVRKHRMYTITPLLSSPKGVGGRRNGRTASYKLTACDRSD